jgi:hypothetical protein
MTTKVHEILNPYSTWNSLNDNEPIYIVRTEDWRLVMYFAINTSAKDGYTSMPNLLDTALKMKEWHDANDIPF